VKQIPTTDIWRFPIGHDPRGSCASSQPSHEPYLENSVLKQLAEAAAVANLLLSSCLKVKKLCEAEILRKFEEENNVVDLGAESNR